MKKPKIILVCDTCGKDMPVDESKSSGDFVVYKTACPCGGKAEIKMEE